MERVVSTQTVLTDEQLKDIFPSLEKIIEDRKDIHQNYDSKIVDSKTLHRLLCDSVKSLFTTLASRLTAKKSYTTKTNDLFNKLKGCILPPKQNRAQRFFTNNTDVKLTPEDVTLIDDIVQDLLQLNILHNGSTTDDIIRYIIRRYIQRKLTNNEIQVKTNNREGLFNRIFTGKKKLYVLFESTGQIVDYKAEYGAEFCRDNIPLKRIYSDLEPFYFMRVDTTQNQSISTIGYNSRPQKYTILEFDPKKRFQDSVAFTNTVDYGIRRKQGDIPFSVEGVFLYISGKGVDNIDKAIQVLDICADEQLGGFSLGEYYYPGNETQTQPQYEYSHAHSRFIPIIRGNSGGKKRSSKKTTKRRCGNSKARYYRRCSPMKHPKKTIRQQRRRFSVRRKKHN